MAKITMLSPVHIATGQIIEAPSYHKTQPNFMNRYDFMEILSQIPMTELADFAFLEKLSRSNSDKRNLYAKIHQYVNYRQLCPLYSLTSYITNIKDVAYDVSEQIKDLDKPYIPGSSIKGMLFSAWIYKLLKANQSLVDKRISTYLNSLANKGKTTFLDLLLSRDSEVNHDEFIKDLRSCILCNDIYFKEMKLYSAKRIGAGKDNRKEMPLTYKECIKEGQEINDVFFTIDDKKLEVVKEKYRAHINLISITNWMKKNIFLSACNEYTKDMLEEEFSDRMQHLYADYAPIHQQLFDMKKKIHQHLDEKQNHYILRIGNSTNYNFKSISLFVKRNYPNLYNEYFERVFSPVRINKNDKIQKVNKNTMPKTRVVFSEDGEHFVLPGFMMVSYDKKS